MIKHFFEWCEDRALGGWALAIAITVAFTTLAVVYIAGLSTEVLAQCGVR